jgi:type IX secretion system PorP/SprF family membrane protein
MKPKYSAACLVLFISIELCAQQDPLYSNYINNPFVINPAYGGMTNNLNATVSYRYQWTGFEGAPVTLNANGHVSLANNKMGAGLILLTDQLGASRTNEMFATYSYRLKLDDKKTLAFGLQGGISNYQINNGRINPQHLNDPLFEGSTSKSAPNLGAGLILTTDRYYLGLSMPRMLEASLEQDDLTVSQYSRHFYAMGSYLFFVSEHLRLRPSVLLKTVAGAPASIDLNAALIIRENYQAGILTRDLNTYGIFTQMLIKDFLRFGYVFEIPVAASVGTRFLTHEVTLGIRFNTLSFHSNNSVFSF